MRIPLAVLAIVACCVCSIEGKDHCSVGPVYHCQALNTSKECHTFEQCKPFWKQSISHKLNIFTQFECQFCEILMTDLQALLNSTATEDEIVAAVSRLCTKIPDTTMQATCQVMANMYLRDVLVMLANKIHPRVVCQSLHMCPGSAYMPQNLNSIMSLAFHGKRELMQIRNPLLLSAPSEDCNDCKRFMVDVRQRLTGNSTAQDVENYLKQTLCPYMPTPSLRELCSQGVHLFVHEVMNVLKQKLDPETDCILIGFCSGNDITFLRQGLARLLAQYPVKLPTKIRDEKCDICKELVEKAKLMVLDPDAVDKLVQLLKDDFCSQLPVIRHECEHYVTIYAPLVLRILGQDLDALEFCQALDACPKSTQFGVFSLSRVTANAKKELGPSLDARRIETLKATPTLDAKVLASSFVVSPMASVLPTCHFCTLLIESIERRLPMARTEAGIVQAMDEVCHILPGETGKRCDEFVKTYGPRVAHMLLEFVAPHLICMALDLCPVGSAIQQVKDTIVQLPKVQVPSPSSDSDSLIFRPVHQPQPAEVNAPQSTTSGSNTFVCDLCKSVVEQADRYLKLNKTDEEVEQYLDSWCHSLSERWSSECINLVHQYTPIILEALASGADPQTVCAEIDLCPSAKKWASLLGRRRCTWGPSFWCSSAINAHRCQATAHCQSKVWMGKRPASKTAM